ncbi:MAG: hypothetical protein JWO87_3141, partial [Phycisphaerales bacterium]|nr:hypothetical protein [Phycisphaerales bacterium]
MLTHFTGTLRARNVLSSAAGVAVAVVGASMARADVSGFGGNGVGWNIQSNGTGYTAGHPSA